MRSRSADCAHDSLAAHSSTTSMRRTAWTRPRRAGRLAATRPCTSRAARRPPPYGGRTARRPAPTYAAPGYAGHLAVEPLDRQRGQAHRQLVEHQHRRVGGQAAGQRQHLLLAARQRAGQLAAPVAELGESGRRRPPRPQPTAGGDPGRHAQVLAHGQVGEHAPALGDEAQPPRRHRVAGAVDLRPARITSPPASRCRPASDVQRVVMPAPLGPRTATTSPAPSGGRRRGAPRSGRTRPDAPQLDQAGAAPPGIAASAAHLRAQVGVEHRPVGPDLARSAPARTAEVEHVDRVALPITRRTSCSTRTTAMPLGRQRQQQVAELSVSPSSWPDAGSSSSSSRGGRQRPGQLDQARLAGGQLVGPRRRETDRR